MNLEVLTTLGALRRLEPEWRELSLPTPMQSPSWLVSWWEAFGEEDPSYELATLAVRDADDRLVGLAPFYLRKQPIVGPTLRLLGDGRASTDHHTVLCRSPEDEPAVVRAVADLKHHPLQGFRLLNRILREKTLILVGQVPENCARLKDWTVF